MKAKDERLEAQPTESAAQAGDNQTQLDQEHGDKPPAVDGLAGQRPEGFREHLQPDKAMEEMAASPIDSDFEYDTAAPEAEEDINHLSM